VFLNSPLAFFDDFAEIMVLLSLKDDTSANYNKESYKSTPSRLYLMTSLVVSTGRYSLRLGLRACYSIILAATGSMYCLNLSITTYSSSPLANS
jgi:hypothetical protein